MQDPYERFLDSYRGKPLSFLFGIMLDRNRQTCDRAAAMDAVMLDRQRPTEEKEACFFRLLEEGDEEIRIFVTGRAVALKPSARIIDKLHSLAQVESTRISALIPLTRFSQGASIDLCKQWLESDDGEAQRAAVLTFAYAGTDDAWQEIKRVFEQSENQKLRLVAASLLISHRVHFPDAELDELIQDLWFATLDPIETGSLLTVIGCLARNDRSRSGWLVVKIKNSNTWNEEMNWLAIVLNTNIPLQEDFNKWKHDVITWLNASEA